MDEKTSRDNYATTTKGTKGIKRLCSAFFYSLDGLRAAWTESAVRQLSALHIILLILIFVFNFTKEIKMILVFASFFSLVVELLNTAIEAAVDHTSLAKHELAKRAKDVASAAQIVALTLLAILWILAFLS